MDATTIRLILIVVGALLIAGLYLWERRQGRKEEEADTYTLDAKDEDAVPYRTSSYTRDSTLTSLDEEDERDPDDERSLIWPSFSKPVGSSDPDDDEESPERLAPSPAAVQKKPELDPLLIQVSVSARRYPFKGAAVMELAETCGLHPGEMDIFHCLDEFDEGTRTYFSMANMVKPGAFPFDDMAHFTTPGLLLFAQLKGDPEDMTILDEMIATARKLAMGLNGDVLDETRRPLTVKKEEDLRMAVYENELRWARAILR
jgi:cell division protein ZipA